jgi:septum site-determining protein MinC
MKRRRQAIIKGSSLPVLRIVVRDGDARSLRTELLETIDNARPLLAEAIAVLDLRERQASDVDAREIVAAVRDADVRLAAVMIGEAGHRDALAELELPMIEAPLSTREVPREPLEEQASSSQPVARSDDATDEAPAALQPQRASESSTGPGLAPLYLTKPLRSGQRVYAQGRDAVVAAPTSRGSELIADGSIYAFSPIRGRVLAGAGGDTSACIVATDLDAELVAVAGVYRTFEADELKAHGGGPVSVTLWLDADGNERLTLAALAPSSSMQRR